jgi:hypothetical protein
LDLGLGQEGGDFVCLEWLSGRINALCADRVEPDRLIDVVAEMAGGKTKGAITLADKKCILMPSQSCTHRKTDSPLDPSMIIFALLHVRAQLASHLIQSQVVRLTFSTAGIEFEVVVLVWR